MITCSTGEAARPHGVGRYGSTHPPSAMAVLRLPDGISLRAATSARISARRASVSGARSMSTLRRPCSTAVRTTVAGAPPERPRAAVRPSALR
ncbi:Uncharacterised protein [Mycobacteroides abscessus subsp. abscessus]|nr:Uncharacterised protein [Mycobacteroides abscessus subsp. abscessus]